MGSLIHEADGLPFPNASTRRSSQHWSIFDIPNYLTRRDEWAGDFSKELVGRGGARALIAIDCYRLLLIATDDLPHQDLTAPRTDCPMHLPDPPTDAEMAEITGRLLSPRHATHVSTGSGRTATDPAKPGQLTARQRRRIKGLAKATDLQLPELSRMDHQAAEAWLLQAEVMHRRMSQSGRFRRDEL
jgi:hypothetical protein